MKNATNMRIPVLFSGLPGEMDAAWLVEDGAEPPVPSYAEHFTVPPPKFGHNLGCNCCPTRGPAADALARLFRARATGAAPFFKCVIVRASPAGEAAIRDAIAGDVTAAARYRLPD